MKQITASLISIARERNQLQMRKEEEGKEAKPGDEVGNGEVSTGGIQLQIEEDTEKRQGRKRILYAG